MSNDWITVNNEMEGMLKKSVVANFNVSSSAGILLLQMRPLHSLGTLETNYLVMRHNVPKEWGIQF